MEHGGPPGPPNGSQPQQPSAGPVPPAPPRRGGRRRYRYRSLFWPLVLVGAGVIWLLYGVGVFSASNLAVVGLVWPILIVGIGVDLLLGHRSPLTGAAVGGVTLAMIIVLMAVGPGLGWVGSTELKTQTFTAPVGEATRARIELGLSGYATSVHALPDTGGTESVLLTGIITYRGSVAFNLEGTTEKTVELRSTGGWQWWQRIGRDTATPWDIALTRSIPLDITVLASSGSSTLDLTGLRLQRLEVDASSGDSMVVLPGGDRWSAALPEIDLQSSSGRMEVQAPEGSAFSMNVDMSSGDTRVALGKDSTADIRFRGSSGQFLLILAPDQALRVDVRQLSSGGVKLPERLARVSGSGREGVWQTAGYESAAGGVNLVIESMSSGTVKIQMEG